MEPGILRLDSDFKCAPATALDSLVILRATMPVAGTAGLSLDCAKSLSLVAGHAAAL